MARTKQTARKKLAGNLPQAKFIAHASGLGKGKGKGRGKGKAGPPKQLAARKTAVNRKNKKKDAAATGGVKKPYRLNIITVLNFMSTRNFCC